MTDDIKRLIERLRHRARVFNDDDSALDDRAADVLESLVREKQDALIALSAREIDLTAMSAQLAEAEAIAAKVEAERQRHNERRRSYRAMLRRNGLTWTEIKGMT
jgi:hypothetical protein